MVARSSLTNDLTEFSPELERALLERDDSTEGR